MFYNLLVPYAHKLHVANLFTYISFRSSLAILLSMVICFLIGPRLIVYLRTIHKDGQPIREDGPRSHFDKAATPTMGGLMILASTIISTLLLANLSNPYIWICLFVLVTFGILGFIDDYTKVSKNNYRGVNGKMKLIIQFLVSIIAFIAIWYYAKPEYATQLSFPFFKNLFVDLGYFYIPFSK